MVDPNTRQSKRTPVTLKIKFKSETLAQFIERYAVDVSQGGIFIRTKEPLPAGTPMRFEFQLKDASPLIAGEGTVVWTRENDPTRPGVAPGMGVRFDRLGDGSQEVLDRILSEKAKQTPAGRQTADTKPPMNAFQEVPTRVAPSPLVNALAGESGRQPAVRSSFTDTRADTTPLPNPMPFHSDADEFPDEAFEEATKVRPLDELVAQSAAMDGEEQPPEIAEALDELAARRLARTSQLPPPTGTPLPAGATPQLATRDATTRADGAASAAAAAAGEASEAGKQKPRMLDTSPSPRTGAPRYSEKVPVAAIAEPLPPPPAMPRTGSRAPLVIILVLIAAAAGAAAVWFLVLRDQGKDKDDVGGGGVGSGSQMIASGVTPPVGSGAGSQVAVGSGEGTGSSTPIVGSGGSGDGSAETPPAADLADVMVNSNAQDAMVEVVGTQLKGPAPFKAKVEKGKKTTIQVTAPGFAAKDVEVTGTEKQVTVTLVAMTRMVHVTSTPSGALIILDSGPTGKVTPADLKLSAAQASRGKLRITLRKPGYQKSDQLIDVKDFVETDGKLIAAVSATLVVQRPSTGGHVGPGSGSATPLTGSGTGSGTPTGTGSDGGTPTGTGSGATPTGTGSGGTPTGTGSGAGSAKPPTGTGSGAGSAAAKPPSGTGSGSAKPPSGTGSGSEGEPTPDWMKK